MNVAPTLPRAPPLAVGLALLASLSACRTDHAASAPSPASEAQVPATSAASLAGLISHTGDPRVLAWVSAPWTFSTTSYAIEAPEGLVLVDTQFLPKDAIRFLEDAERATGKKAVAAIVLHANPDKFNGTAALQARGVRVLTSRQVKDLIPAVHAKRLRAFGDRYAPDYPIVEPSPEVFGAATTELRLAGTTVKLHVVGPGCSAAHVVLEWEGNVFAGDLLADGAHAWLEIGETAEWLERLDEIDALRPVRVHPGRGLPGGPDLVRVQRRYLEDVVAAVAAARPVGEPDDGALASIKRALVAKYPALRFAVFLDLGLPAEWRRQADGDRPINGRLPPSPPRGGR
jgi:glyoxylase-like metal-dependent hydrolase (beta-lactamase superfamily II)